MASGIAAKTIFFVATLLVSLVTINIFIHSINTSSVAMDERSDFYASKMKSRLKIESFAYNDANNKILAYVKNTGDIKINPEHLNIYLDGDKISRCENFSMNITSDSNIVDEKYYNPGEIMRIVFTGQIDNSAHKLIVTDKYGNKDVFNDILQNTTANYEIIPPSWCDEIFTGNTT
ncbi:MAG: hypothetical protein ACQER9_01300 [Nanobdellota archaeon]